MYDTEALASYLLYRLNVLNPVCAYPRTPADVSHLAQHRLIYGSYLPDPHRPSTLRNFWRPSRNEWEW